MRCECHPLSIWVCNQDCGETLEKLEIEGLNLVIEKDLWMYKAYCLLIKNINNKF